MCFVDRLDGITAEEAKTSPPQSPTPAQPGEMEVPPDLLQVADSIGGGGRTRTYDLRIMSCPAGAENKETKDLRPADSGKNLHNPHHPRTKVSTTEESFIENDEGYIPPT